MYARECVCDIGKKGKGLRKQSWDALVTFTYFFFSLPLVELEIKTQPIQLRDRPFNLKEGGGHGYLLKKII